MIVKNEDEYVDSMGVKKSVYIKESQNGETYHNYIQGTDLLNLEEGHGSGGTNAIDDLLGMGGNKKKEESKSRGGIADLLDIDNGPT